jgi:hypothetical protein
VGCNLTGLHRTIACFDCHKNGNFTAISPQCPSCHMEDAVRHGASHVGPAAGAYRLSCTAGVCHNPNYWAPQGNFGARDSVCR